MFWFPPILQRFLRSKTWWDVIKYTPADGWRYLTRQHPALGVFVVCGGYWYFWKNPVKVAERQRFERFRDNWRADVHVQENVDWENKSNRDSMRDFITTQIEKYGSFDKAIQAFENKTGRTAPPMLLNDAVLDHAMGRVGVPINGDEEPQFLWDGTAYMSDKDRPLTFPDGKIKLPEAPTFYTPR